METLAKKFKNSRKIGLCLLLTIVVFVITGAKTNNGENEPLNEQEKIGLVYSLEEARLTKDVNTFLYSKWEEPIFDYVLSQENMNMLRIQKLILKYGGENPLAYSVEGKFTIPALQEDFNKFINVGKNNEQAALYVSMTLAERNYLHMQERIAEANNLELIKLYGKRMTNTGKSIRVLFKKLGNLGPDYEPQYMDENEFFDLILKDRLKEISM